MALMRKSNQLPTAHWSPITWTAIGAVALAIAAVVIWAIFLAEPTIMR